MLVSQKSSTNFLKTLQASKAMLTYNSVGFTCSCNVWQSKASVNNETVKPSFFLCLFVNRQTTKSELKNE